MSKDTKPAQKRIDQFLSGPGGRADDWRDLVEGAKVWARGGDRANYDAALAVLSVTEEFHGYPGLRLMAALREAASAGDAATSLALATRITQALTTRSFRQHAGDWSLKDDGNGEAPDLVPTTFGQQAGRRPYFETLIVTGLSSSDWPALATEWRKLRRPVDAFIYEPVIVGSLEDAFCAVMLNPNIAAVVINEGFALRSRHDASVLRPMMTAAGLNEESDASALRLAHIIKRVRPELDLYLMSNRDVEADGWKPRRQRVPADLLFDRRASGAPSLDPGRHPGSLRHPVLRQSQEICAAPDRDVPCAADRARQVRLQIGLDPGHGRILRPEPVPGREQRDHRRSRQPAGADRQHQEGAGQGGPRARRGSRLLRDQRHLDVEQDGRSGAARAGRHRDRRSQLPQIAPLRHGAGRRAAALCRSVPDDGIFDVWRGAAEDHQAGAAERQGRRPARSGQDA